MQITSILALALPAAVLAQSTASTTATSSPSTTSTSTSASAASTADLEAICESGNPGYADKCPQCLHECESSAYPEQCFFSIFSVVNEIESDCEAHGASNCENQAVSEVCGSS